MSGKKSPFAHCGGQRAGNIRNSRPIEKRVLLNDRRGDYTLIQYVTRAAGRCAESRDTTSFTNPGIYE